MQFDLRTLILILGITHLIQVIVFYYQFRANRQLSGPGWWLLWSATELLGFICVLIRSATTANLLLIIIFQNLIMLLGPVFIYIGILEFYGMKPNFKALVLFLSSFLILHLYFLFADNNLIIRSVIFSLFIALISFITAYAVNKYKNRATALTANFITIIFLAHSVVFIVRSVLLLRAGGEFKVSSSDLTNLLAYLDALVVALLWTFGLIMMINQKLNFDIREAKTHFELIFKSSPDAVLITRLNDGFIVECNDSFSRITGYAKSEILGQTTLSIGFWTKLVDRENLIENLRKKGVSENFEFLFQRKNGETRTGLYSARTLDIKGEPHQLGVIHDITERKLREEEIKNKNEQLGLLNLEKDKFFSIIAHDLRSPFGSFLGLTELLTEQLHLISKDRLEQLVRKLKESASNLYQLLENLLEWSRMEQGAIPFRPVNLNVWNLVNESIAMMTDMAKTKSIDIHCHIPQELNINADWHMVQSIIRNLVSNAVKFSHRGSSVEISAVKNRFNQVEFRIRDSGIGMSPEIQQSLFRITARSNRKGTEGEASSGLGLILCKSFVEKHNGTISVESETGKGTVFCFTIPGTEDSFTANL